MIENDFINEGRFTPRKQYLTKDDARQLFQFKSVRTIERLMASGKLPFIRIGRSVRFSEDAIRKHLEGV